MGVGFCSLYSEILCLDSLYQGLSVFDEKEKKKSNFISHILLLGSVLLVYLKKVIIHVAIMFIVIWRVVMS